jgi:hypothetical protein
MKQFLYWVLATPFIIPAKISEFLVWDLFGSKMPTPTRESRHFINQDQGVYIQKILKELDAQKRRNGDLHGYYGREQKKLIDSFERDQRRREELRRSQNR